MDTVKYCPVCGEVYCFLVTLKDKSICGNCKSTLIDTGKTLEQYYTELNTREPENVQKYIREKYIYIDENKLFDPIKENKRLKEIMELEDAIKKAQNYKQQIQKNTNTPRCPTCGSTNVEKISGVSKFGKAALFGIFSVGTLTKTFRCKNCGMKF